MTRVTLGKSRVRESRTPGSVRAKAEWLSYSTMIHQNAYRIVPPPHGSMDRIAVVKARYCPFVRRNVSTDKFLDSPLRTTEPGLSI
jgi:hypothetical protein